MKESDIPKMNIPNAEAALAFIAIDDAMEAQTGQSVLGKTKTFLMEIIEDTKDSTIPGAFSAVLNQRLTGKLKSAHIK